MGNGIMSKIVKSFVGYPMVALTALALAACGDEAGDSAAETQASSSDSAADPTKTLFASDFEGVCSGATVSAAAAYDPAGEGHKVLMFETWKNDDLIERSSSLPDDWTVQFSAEENMYKQVDLVLCAKRTAETKVKTCEGYKSDGKETQNKVNWHTATYELTLVEATTGKTVAEGSVNADSDSCPMFQSFENESDVVDGYARPSDASINDFLKPHMGA